MRKAAVADPILASSSTSPVRLYLFLAQGSWHAPAGLASGLETCDWARGANAFLLLLSVFCALCDDTACPPLQKLAEFWQLSTDSRIGDFGGMDEI